MGDPKMTVAVKQIAHIKLGGGVRHRIGIVMATEVALRRGYQVEDMSTWRGYSEEPDLVIRKAEHEKNPTRRHVYRYRVEVIDSHDPIPDWDGSGGYDDAIKIIVKDLDANGILLACEVAIP